MSLWMKIIFLLFWPINLIRRLSIPVYTSDTWNRLQASTSPLVIILLLLYHTPLDLSSYLWSIPIYILALTLALSLGVFIFRTSKKSVLPEYNIWLVWVGFGMSLLWICNICSVMIDLLNLSSILLNFPSPVLGMTLLAWGNSSSDLVANLAIAKAGMSSAALTACFAGPLFNMLLGLGIGCVISSYEEGIEFKILDRVDIGIGLVFLMCSLSISILTVIIEKGNIGRRYSFIMIAMYCGFLCVMMSYLIYSDLG